ncbi:MAG: DUF664 domain-containing protein, partial [Actinomycetes bacterium]
PGLAYRLPSSRLSLGGLLKHLACAEDMIFSVKLRGRWEGEDWRALGYRETDVPDEWFFESAAADRPDDLYGFWDRAVERSRARLAAAIAAGGLDQAAHVSDDAGHHASLRRLVCDLIEEYGRHTGHADLLREAVDGRVGEDPPDDWRPVSGSYRP